MTEKVKSCSICGEEKPFECFGKHVRMRYGLRSACKECERKLPYTKRTDEQKAKERKSESRDRLNLSDNHVKKIIWREAKRIGQVIAFKDMTEKMIEERRQLVIGYRNRPIIIPKCKVYFPECEICGEIFTTTYKLTICCSDECRMVNHLRIMRERYKDEWQQPEPFECKECGEIVIIEFGDMRLDYCSDLCREKYGRRNHNHRNRIRIMNGYIESVSMTYICKRDNCRCHICHKKVNMKLKHPHLMSATLDHIIALADGGTHERKNMALAHMICNSRKRDIISEGGDQLRLYG